MPLAAGERKRQPVPGSRRRSSLLMYPSPRQCSLVVFGTLQCPPATFWSSVRRIHDRPMRLSIGRSATVNAPKRAHRRGSCDIAPRTGMYASRPTFIFDPPPPYRSTSMNPRGLRKMGNLGALRRPAPAPLQREASAVRVKDHRRHTHPNADTHPSALRAFHLQHPSSSPNAASSCTVLPPPNPSTISSFNTSRLSLRAVACDSSTAPSVSARIFSRRITSVLVPTRTSYRRWHCRASSQPMTSRTVPP